MAKKNYSEYINQRFGFLTVTDTVTGPDKKQYFACSCDCGELCYIRTDHLIAGTRTTCNIRCPFAQRRTSTNESRCIYFYKSRQKYKVSIKIKGQLVYVGMYDAFEDAVSARDFVEDVKNNFSDEIAIEFTNIFRAAGSATANRWLRQQVGGLKTEPKEVALA